MATFSRRERVEKTVEFFVPAPSTWVEVDKAATVAYQEFQSIHGKFPSDDEIMLKPGDDEIVIWFRGKL